jgi:AraC-like DNA-binding protein
MPTPAKLLHIGHLHPSPLWRMPDQRHLYHEMIVPIRGRMILRCPNGRFMIEPGDVLIYPAGMSHEEESDPANPVESYFLTFRGPQIQGSDLLRRRDHAGRMRQIIRWLQADRFARDPLAPAERTALFHALLARFFREDQGPEPELAQRLRAFVRDHLGERLTLDRLAGEAGLSRYYFARTYRRLTGHSPMKDVRRLRLEYARDLVMTTKLPLKAIAEKTGLGSPYALSRLFHRQFDRPPGAFRRQFNEAD